MVMVTYIVIINILAMIGLIAIIYMIDEIKTDIKIKKEKARKEQMRKELLEIMDEIMEEEE